MSWSDASKRRLRLTGLLWSISRYTLRTGLPGTALRATIASKSLLDIISSCLAVHARRSDPGMAQYHDEGYDERAHYQ